jgi:hypothetical protein
MSSDHPPSPDPEWKRGDDPLSDLLEPGRSLVARLRAEGRNDATIRRALHFEAERAERLASETAPPGSPADVAIRYEWSRREKRAEAMEWWKVLAELERRDAVNAAVAAAASPLARADAAPDASASPGPAPRPSRDYREDDDASARTLLREHGIKPKQVRNKDGLWSMCNKAVKADPKRMRGDASLETKTRRLRDAINRITGY